MKIHMTIKGEKVQPHIEGFEYAIQTGEYGVHHFRAEDVVTIEEVEPEPEVGDIYLHRPGGAVAVRTERGWTVTFTNDGQALHLNDDSITPYVLKTYYEKVS